MKRGWIPPSEDRQCAAHSKRSGSRCRKWAMRGHTVCRNHGALSPRGVASPAFKTGRYSRSLPARLVGRYQEAVADPELLSLRDDLALIDSRTSALLQRV